MNSFFTCSARAAEAGHGATRIARRAGSAVTVDIHCHVVTPEAVELTKAHFRPEYEPAIWFASPESRVINRAQQAAMNNRLTTAEVRLTDMDRLDIDVQAISPAPLQYYYWADAELGRSAARLINNRLSEIASHHPDRFVALGTVPLQAPELAVAEMQRCARELGMRGIEICSNVNGKELSDLALRPVFAAAEELDILIFIHPMGFTQGDRMREHYLSNTIGNPLDSTIAVSHLISGGVLESYPGLKICVAHGGGYLPMYSGRCDHAYHARADCRAHISRPPSEYLKRLFFDSVVFDRQQLEYMVAKYGADHVLMGSDYPYDMAEQDPVGFVTSAALSPEDRAKIMGGNAARLLKIGTPAVAR